MYKPFFSIPERFATNGFERRLRRRLRHPRNQDVDKALLRLLQNSSGRGQRVLPQVRESNFEKSVGLAQRRRFHENSHFR